MCIPRSRSIKINCASDKKQIVYIGGSASEKYLGHQELHEDPVEAGKVEWDNPPTEDNIVTVCA